MRQTLLRVKSGEYFILGRNGWESLGENRGSVGPYGNSSGIFFFFLTVCPLNEWAEKNGVKLFWERSLVPVPTYL